MNEVGKQKYEITQCQSQEITLSKRIGIFLHLFYFNDNRVSCSSRIEKLPSSYPSESAEWKVLHEKKKKNDKTSFASFGQFHRIPSILRTLLLCFK